MLPVYAHKLACRAPPSEASGPLEVEVLGVLRRGEDRRGVRALAVRDAWGPVARDVRVRRVLPEIWIVAHRAAQSVAALAREDSRERRAAMDSNSVLVVQASQEQRWGERELPALLR